MCSATNYVPHDGDRKILWLEQAPWGEWREGLGFRPLVVQRPSVKGEAMASSRHLSDFSLTIPAQP